MNKTKALLVLLMLPLWCYGHDPTMDFDCNYELDIDEDGETGAIGETEVALYRVPIVIVETNDREYFVNQLKTESHDYIAPSYRREEVGWNQGAI